METEIKKIALRKIISFSLYGDSDEYYTKFILNTPLYKEYFFDFEIFLYAEINLATKLEYHCKLNNICLILKERLSEADGMFWRFEPIINELGDLCVVRDVDYLPSSFELNLLNEFFSSNKGFHILRTHYDHKMPILGGLFAIKKECYHHFIIGYNNWIKKNIYSNIYYNDDQLFLAKYVYNEIKEKSLIHTSNVAFLFEKYKVINPGDKFIIGGDERHSIDKKKSLYFSIFLPVFILKWFNFKGMRFLSISFKKC